MKNKQLIVLKEVRDGLDKTIQEEFRKMSKDCSYNSLAPACGIDEGGWFKCSHPDHPYYLASITTCGVNGCPLLRRK